MRIMKNTYKIILTFTLTLLFQFGVNAQTLDSLFQLAVENNSELKAVNSEFQSILLKQDQVSQLPNPQIGVGVPILRPETRLGPQVMMVSATQMFPWFGTFDAKKEVVLQMSKAKYEELSAIKLDLFYQIKVAYFKIQFLSQKEHLYEEAISNYKTIESIALAKVESGQATLADVLRIQTKVEEYTNLMKQIENEKSGLYSQINNITNQPLDQEVIIKDSL
ncbi:MAG: TolC family protein, partial [Crocinitomicaceae bacterium]|nr:TolC family protein [Crocinitomicaceae bacterium]